MTQAMRFDVNATDRASATFAKIATAAERLEEKLKDLNKRYTPTVKLVGVAETRREVSSLRRDFDRIRDIRARVRVAVTGNAQLTNLSQQLDRLSDARVAVHVSILPPGVELRLRTLATQLRALRGTTEHTVVVNERGSSSVLGRLSNLGKSLTGSKGLVSFTNSLMAVGAAATVASASLGSMTAAVATLGGAVVGTVPILVAGAGMIGGVLATLQVGTQGLSHAFEALAEGDMKKWGEALANLSPEAQKFAVAIKDVWGELRQAQGAIQDNLFQGMGEAVRTLAVTELPMLKEGMGAVATELNVAAKGVMAYIGSAEGIDRQRTMWANTATVVRNLAPGFTNLTAAMFDIGEVGSKVLADITGGTGEAGLGFRNMIAEARRTGELERVMRQGVETLQQMGRIAGNVGSILGSVFTAARTAGADFLTTLERGTSALAEFMKSGAGQTAMVDFFREARATLDALGVGLAAAGKAAAAFVSAFSNSGGLSAAGAALSDLMVAVAPLAETLGRLAGETLGVLASAASNLAAVLAPVVSLISGTVSALGPLAPTILAAVVAFAGLRAAAAGLSTLGAAASAAALKMGVYTTAVTGSIAAGTRAASAATVLGVALRGLSLAIPVIGVALVAATALFGAFGEAAKASAEDVASGSATMRQAIDAELESIRQRDAAYAGMQGEGYAVGQVIGEMTGKIDANAQALAQEQEAVANAEAKWQEYRATLSPMEQLNADVARAQGELNDAVVLFGQHSPQAAAAAAVYAAALDRQKAAEDGAKAAADAHNQSLEGRIGAVQSALGAMLQMEAALSRVADAEKRANEAAKEHGEGSKEAADANREFAGAADVAAKAAQEQAVRLAESQGATNAADFGARAYASTLAQVAATASGPAKAGLLSYLASLSDADLAAVNAAAAASGFKVEMMALPDGRNIAIAVDPETGEIISTQQLLDTIQDKTITINGNAMPAQQALTSVLSQVAAGAESIEINGEVMPAQQALATVLGMITGSTGTVTINGQAHPAQAVLDATIAAIAAGSAEVTIGGNRIPLDQVLAAVIGAIGSSSAQVTLDANAAPVNAARTEVQQPTQSTHTIDPNAAAAEAARGGLEMPSSSTHTVNPDTGAAQGAVTGLQAPTSSTHTVNPNAAPTQGAIQGLQAPTASVHTINVDPAPVSAAIANAQLPTQSMHTLNADDRAVVDAKRRAEQPTQSMHTINCNDSAVVAAKSRARQNTSSTHTIHVVTVGAGPPRAVGAYATPRAKGAYATAYAAGGMRRMSAARAEIVPPRQPRIIGDRMRGDEAFIPIDGSARSHAILTTAADRMGYDLAPRMSGAASAVQSVRDSLGARAALPAPRGAGGGDGGLLTELRQLNNQLGALRGDVDHHGDNAAIVGELRAVRAALARVRGAGTATADAQRSRNLTDLGAF